MAVGAFGRGLADLGADVNVGAGAYAVLAVLSEAHAAEVATA